MKIDKTEFAQKLNKIKGVVPKKTTMKALQGILLMNGYLIANNMEMTIKAKIEGTADESFIIPDRAFDLINNLPDGEIEITQTGDNQIIIKADKIKNKYQSLDAASFPIMDQDNEGSEFTIKSEVLLESIRRVAYAIPAQATTPSMTTMCLQATGGKLNFAGLDGHVLAWDKVDFDGDFTLLIPKNTVEKLKSIGLSGDVKIKHNKTGAIFVTDEFEIYTRVVDGQYFKYQQMFGDMPLHTVVSRMQLMDAMTRAKMCTAEKSPVHFNVGGNSLALSINDGMTDYHETVDLQEEISEPIVIGFDARLVLETLKAFDCENVGLQFSNPTHPMMVEAEDSDFRTLVLPVKIR